MPIFPFYVPLEDSLSMIQFRFFDCPLCFLKSWPGYKNSCYELVQEASVSSFGKFLDAFSTSFPACSSSYFSAYFFIFLLFIEREKEIEGYYELHKPGVIRTV